MNSFKGHIIKIEVKDQLSIVSIQISDENKLHAVVVETPETAEYLSINQEIKVLFKETEVIIGKGNDLAVSIQNRISGVVTHIEKGVLLTKVTIKTRIGDIESIISTRAVHELNIKQNDSVVAMVKLNEIMLGTI
jgi:molybdopterin-binding protein